MSYKSKSVIKREYSRRLNHLRVVFPAAYRFLTHLEKISPRVWFGTDSNMHLYKGDCYLLRVVLSKPESSQPCLILKKKYHMQIFAGTIDCSDRIFLQKLPVLIDLNGGFDNLWAHWTSEDSIKLRVNTPEKFFADLIREIETIDC